MDPKLIERTQQWLAGQQQADGSWKPDTQFINEGATNRYNSDVLRITAYLGMGAGEYRVSGPGSGPGARVCGPAPGREDGRVHAGGGGEFRGGLREGPRFHEPGDAAAGGCAHGEGRAGVVGVAGDGHVFHGGERGGGDDGAGGAGAAEMGRGFGDGAQGAGLPRVEEGRHGRLGDHAGDHHGAAGAAALDGKRRGGRAGDGRDLAERQDGARRWR